MVFVIYLTSIFKYNIVIKPFPMIHIITKYAFYPPTKIIDKGYYFDYFRAYLKVINKFEHLAGEKTRLFKRLDYTEVGSVDGQAI